MAWVKRAGTKHHKLLKGTSREEAIARFLAERLPARFGVTTGEAVDANELRTGQLDVVIYDQNLTAPLLAEQSSELLPAESLLAVVEVKSKLDKEAFATCAAAARKLSQLEPYGKPFLPPRQKGAPADDGRHRCQYSVIAFSSDAGADGWVDTDWRRLCEAAQSADVDPNRIDRVLVLDRGMLVPPFKSARVSNDGGKGMLREWFLHMSNFLVREAERRPPFDFQRYGRRRKNPGWQKL